MIEFVIRFRYFILCAWAGIFLALVGGYFKGRADGVKLKEAEYALADVKRQEEHAKEKRKVISLGDVDLRREYCSWVRDNKDECLRADIPLREGQDD